MPKPTLRFDIRGDDQSRAAFNSLRSNLAQTQSQTAIVRQQLLGFSQAFKAAFFGVGITQASHKIREIVSGVSEIGKVADKVGVTTEALQELRFAAELTGVSTTALDMGLQRFSRRIAEAAAGTGVLKDVLEANNIALHNADGTMRSNEELLADYADLIRNAASEQDALRLAFLAFDSEGAAVVNTLRNGRDGLADLRAEAHRAGGVFGDEMVRKMEALDDQFSRLSRTIGMGFKGAILDAAEQIQYLAQQIDPALLDALKVFDKWVREHSPQALGGRTGEALRNIFGLNKQGAAAPGLHGEGLNPMAGIAALEGLGTSSFSGSLPDIESLTGRTTKITADSADKAAEKIASVVSALQAEYDAMLMTAEAQELYNNLTRAGVELNSEQGGEIAALTVRIQGLREEQLLAAEAQEAVNDAADQFADAAYSSFASFISGAESAEDAIKRLGLAIADAYLQSLLLGKGPLASLFGTDKSGGLLNNLFKGAFQGFFAEGGMLGAGKWGIAGENGPEIVKGPAEIVPMKNVGMIPSGSSPIGRGGGETIINLYGAQNPVVERRRTPRGEIIDIMMGEVGKRMTQGGFDQELSERTGGRPAQNNLVA